MAQATAPLLDSTLAVHCGNGFDAGFRPLSKYSFEPIQSCLLSLGADMRRREFIKLLSGTAVAWPLAARGQQSRIARIGALYIGLADAESFKKELREGLRELGYVEGQNVAFEFRSAEGRLDRLPELAAELVRLKVDVIVALYVPCALCDHRS
jgi:hypothetical protein